MKVLLQVDPTNVEAMYTLGLIHTSLNQHQEAYSALHRAVEDCPNYVSALYQLCALYVRGGECGRASEALSQLKGLSPHHTGAQKLRDKCKETI